MKRIYLAGPISGCTYDGCTAWRQTVADSMPEGVECLSPMRGKDALKGVKTLSHEAYKDSFLCSDAEILGRDHNDCTKSDLILVNFLGATKPSLGTAMEIAWGYDHHIPVVMAMEREGNPNDHGMIRRAVGFRYDNLTVALYAVCRILNVRLPEL